MSIFEYDKVEEEKQTSVKTATRMLRMGSFSLEQIAGIFLMIISMLVSFMFSKRIRKLDMVEIIKQNSNTFSFQNPCGILREKVFLSV